MTVIALGRRDGYAFLATDAAEFGAGGTITRIQRKLLSLEHLNAVAAIAGVGDSHVKAGLYSFAGQFTEPRDFVRALPGYAEELRAAYNEPGARFAFEECPRISTFYVALFDRTLGSPLCVSVLPADGNARGGAPFALGTPSTLFVPSAPAQRWPGNSFEPDADAAELAAIFRGSRTPDGLAGAGGWLDVATVSADGITLSTVAQWPDRIGARMGD